MAEKERKLPAVVTSPETEEYWAAAKEGKLLVKKCKACGKTHHYPRSLCPHCFSDKTEWTTASGKGVLYSYSVMRRAPVPYALAYVTLAEGTTMMTNMVDYGMDPQEALDHPRVFFENGRVELEQSVPAEAEAGLKAMGHPVAWRAEPWGGGQIVAFDRSNGTLIGASDARKDGMALGY